MSEFGKTTLVVKKSYEIAYALCRIAAKIPEKHFAEAFADKGVKMLGFVAEDEYDKAEKTLAAVEYFIKLGMGVGSIDSTNGEVLLGEIALLNEIIAGLLNAPKVEPADLSGIFTPISVPANSFVPAGAFASSNPSVEYGSAIREPGFLVPSFMHSNAFVKSGNESGNHEIFGKDPAMELDNPAIISAGSGNNPARSGNENNAEIIELIKSGNRHGAILEKIRQSGNCRIKDIHDLFPECSERTLRYDLQSLTEQNLIEKIGTGGPAVFYKRRE